MKLFKVRIRGARDCEYDEYYLVAENLATAAVYMEQRSAINGVIKSICQLGGPIMANRQDVKGWGE